MNSEFDFLKLLRHKQKRDPSDKSIIKGIGDDAAVLRQITGQDTLVTSDLLVEGVDFNRDSTRPDFLGQKALAVSLSDIAAMGGSPQWALLSMGIPEEVWRSQFVNRFFDGFLAFAHRYRVTLIGGDISRTPKRIVVDSTVLGSVNRNGAVLRSGARAGDHIFVTGVLGGAAAGLKLIEENKRVVARIRGSNPKTMAEGLLARQLRPEPRVEWGESLGKSSLATAMIDISDGLSSDLGHICNESGVGAIIDKSLIPIDPLVTTFCRKRSIDPMALALNGGEDFELLFTVASRNVRRLPKKIGRVATTEIGTIVDTPKCILLKDNQRTTNVEPLGYQHFK